MSEDGLPRKYGFTERESNLDSHSEHFRVWVLVDS
jgi:hypothetical protein